MGPKPTAVDQAGRPPRRSLAGPSGFQTADITASDLRLKTGGLDDGDHLLCREGAVGDDHTVVCFVGDGRFEHSLSLLQHTLHAP